MILLGTQTPRFKKEILELIDYVKVTKYHVLNKNVEHNFSFIHATNCVSGNMFWAKDRDEKQISCFQIAHKLCFM
jgi:hypothetical protein